MTTAVLIRNSFHVQMKQINDGLEKAGFYGWYFGYEEDKKVFFLSLFDEHNPQEELVFLLDIELMKIRIGHRFNKKKSVIKEDNFRSIEANAVWDHICASNDMEFLKSRS